MWWRIGWLGFGGPAGQIALMHRELVVRRRWVDEPRFLHALNYCMLLPGPEAQQLAIYLGWLLHRTPGGIAAGVLFVLPGALAILLLSILYAFYGRLVWVEAMFYGLKPAVIAIVVSALIELGQRALRQPARVGIAAAAFGAIFLYAVPFPVVVLAAGLIGFAAGGLRLPAFVLPAVATAAPAGNRSGEDGGYVIGAAEAAAPHTRPHWGRSLRVIATCLALWLMPLLAGGLALGRDHVILREGIFFSQVALLSFGGAYAALAFVAQAAVGHFGWLTAGQMLDGLGLAETTPGPLILTVQFVGFMGAWHAPGSLPPLLAGILGSLLVTWVTFVPCFLWILLGAPFVERLREHVALASALAAITAAVVGVIFNLSVWFALHVLFGRLGELRALGARVLAPDWASLDAFGLGVALLAFGALRRLRWGIASVIGAAALLGIAARLLPS